MIATLLAFCYITLICWSYGDALLRFIEKLTKNKLPAVDFIVTCFAGLAAIGTLFTTVSLFLPLGGIPAQLLLLIPVLAWLFFSAGKKFPLAINDCSKNFFPWPAFLKITFFSCVLLILIMHSSQVNHPDTLNYHAQNIKWIEEHRVVPGLANLLSIYALQSSWFILSALFSFGFTGTTALTFINAVILIWFVQFVIQRISDHFHTKRKQDTVYGFLWLCLLVLSFWTYTQLRLTATSASSDFITAIYILLTVYFSYKYKDSFNRASHLLLVFFSFFAVTVKLQSLPIVLLPLYHYYRYDKSGLFSKLLLTAFTGIVVIVPFLVRNVISSGYLLFPSTFPDIFSVDWKTKKEYMSITQDYITAYARTRTDFSNLAAAKNMQLTEWLPVWWQLRSPADKLTLLGIPGLFLLSLLRYKKVFTRQNRYLLTILLLLIPGLIFWFITAPDPRFGAGFLLAIPAILAYLIINSYEEKIQARSILLSVSTLLLGIVFLGYSAYRLYYYFNTPNIIQPAGLAAIPYHTVNCNGINMNRPDDHELCAGTDLPCTRIDCSNILPRGKSIEDGFKLK